MNDKDDFFRFVKENCGAPDGGTAFSYTTAIDKLCMVFGARKPEWAPTSNVWEMNDAGEIESLCENVKKEQTKFRKGGGGIFGPYKGTGDSYFRKYWTGAALRFFARYRRAQMAEAAYEKELGDTIADSALSGTAAAKKASKIKVRGQALFLPEGINPKSKIGKEIIHNVRIRCNQRVFRSAILNNYQHKCCVCGLDEDALLDAAHITEWSADLSNALDATNGLCLSATYHRAFDAHLIGFDDRYRLRLSSTLKKKCTRQVYQDYFVAFEGKVINLPVDYKPNTTALMNHLDKVLS